MRLRISIHTLRVEGDKTPEIYLCTTNNFNPHPPCGGRHNDGNVVDQLGIISIHTLRVEGDVESRQIVSRINYFNPHPPCGGRPDALFNARGGLIFQSTPSVWRATSSSVKFLYGAEFQSTPSVWRATHYDI